MAKLIVFVMFVLLIVIVCGQPVDISIKSNIDGLMNAENFIGPKYKGAHSQPAVSGVAGANSVNNLLSSSGTQRQLLSARMRSGKF